MNLASFRFLTRFHRFTSSVSRVVRSYTIWGKGNLTDAGVFAAVAGEEVAGRVGDDW